MSLLERLEVPAAQSRASTRPVASPRVAASSAMPAPTTPPPTTSTSSSCSAMRRERFGALRRTQSGCPHRCLPSAPSPYLAGARRARRPWARRDRRSRPPWAAGRPRIRRAAGLTDSILSPVPDIGHRPHPTCGQHSTTTRPQCRITVIFTPSLTVRSLALSTGLARLVPSGYWEGRLTPCPQTSPSSASATSACPSPRPPPAPASAPSATTPTRGRSPSSPPGARPSTAPSPRPRSAGCCRAASAPRRTRPSWDGSAPPSSAPRPGRAPRAPSICPPSPSPPAPSPPGCAAHHRAAGVARAARHHRGRAAPAPGGGLRAARRSGLPPRVLPARASTRATARTATPTPPRSSAASPPPAPSPPPRSTAASRTRSSGPAASARRRRSNCWRPTSGTSTSRWSTRWPCSATNSARRPVGRRPLRRDQKPFGFQAFRPGPGVGGHGVPVDTVGAHRPLHLVELAGRINERMPQYVTARCADAPQ